MMFLWVIVLIAVIVGIWYFTSRRKKNPLVPDEEKETPMAILKKRYAKGEISQEEYEKRKKELEEKKEFS